MSVGNFIDKWVMPFWSVIASTAGGGLIAYIDVFDVKSPILFFLGAAGLTVGSIDVFIKLLRLERLTTKNENLKKIIERGHKSYSDYWNDLCREVYQDLELTERHRLTVYKFDEKKSCFVLLGRFADHHSYRNAGRKRYPSDQGVIGDAWLKGESYEAALPNPEQTPAKYTSECQKRWKMPKDVAADLKMKSTSLWALALRKKSDQVKFAIVVVESVRKNDIDAAKMRDAFKNGLAESISRQMTALANLEPDLAEANRMGF